MCVCVCTRAWVQIGKIARGCFQDAEGELREWEGRNPRKEESEEERNGRNGRNARKRNGNSHDCCVVNGNSHDCCVVPRGAPCDDTALAYDIAY